MKENTLESLEILIFPPQPVVGWNSILDAVDDKSQCIQADWLFESNPVPKGSEDCLFLNVYTPKLPKEDGHLKEVLFYIHGGGWSTGSSSSDLYGPHYFMDRDVVLVTFNYRLGALGFLSTEDTVSPGNYGMKDQVQALRWVRDNIRAFGGNPDSVTVFGQSVGGASAHYHMMSPMSAGLFHRAILHSGNALAPWATARNARAIAKKQGELLGCPTNSSHSLVECLRTKDAKAIAGSYTSLLLWDIDPQLIYSVVPERIMEFGNEVFLPEKPYKMLSEKKYVLGPLLIGLTSHEGCFRTAIPERDVSPGDEVFLPEEPHKLLSEANYSSVPLMAGITKQDGCFRTAILWRSPDLLKELDVDFDEIAPITYRYQETALNEGEVTRRIQDFYYGNRPIGTETEKNITKAYTDRLMLVDLVESLNIMAKNNLAPAYFYHFSYKGINSFSKLISRTDYDFGVCHQDDLLYLFSSLGFFPHPEPGSPDDAMVDVMLELWVNFAKTGNPTPEMKPLDWPPYSTEEKCHFKIGARRKVQCGGLHNRRVQFWNSLCLMENGNKLQCGSQV